jgi:flagellar M-ring protein FliF
MTSAIPPAMLDGVRRMNGTRRFLALATVAAVLITIWGITRYGQTPDLVPLYQGLELRDAAAMADALQKAGIRYELDAGGTAIMVAKGDLATARVAIAKAGVRAEPGRSGDDFLKGQNWGRTDREMATLERRDLEDALGRSLETLSGIARATVHLSLPEQSPLRKLDRPAKASVVITTRGGIPLSTEEVASVTYLVSNAVVNLTPDQVAVLDAEGRLLSAPNDASGRGLTSRQLEMQRSVEDYLATNAQRMLATVLGPGDARVQVNARLNFEQVEKSIETYNPDGAVLQNEQRSEVTGGDSLAGGNSTVVNNTYQNSRVLEKVVGAVGGIERLTVAVLINDKAIAKVAGPTSNKVQELSRYEQIVRDAIGMDSTRGDRITVLAQPFEPLATADSLADRGGGGSERVLVVAERFSRPLVGIAGIVAALLLGLRVLRMPRDSRPSGPGGSLAAGGEAGGSFGPADADPELPPVRISALNATTTRLKSEVQTESTHRPEMAASVVKAWLAEGG